VGRGSLPDRSKGEVREAYPFGPHLRLRRRWQTELGACSIELEDEVTNEGHRPEIHMQLYHWNFGFRSSIRRAKSI